MAASEDIDNILFCRPHLIFSLEDIPQSKEFLLIIGY